ncbi:MAG: hypothetical protein MZV70_65185 [Desulfobacterales bacterium]|nr:hypothetical protein [Desulfobacterales bacterium]
MFHHFTFYGFLLCFASTTVAAIYDYVFGWPAPYGYTQPAGDPRDAGRTRAAGGPGRAAGPQAAPQPGDHRRGADRDGHRLPGAAAARERERTAPARAAGNLCHGDPPGGAPRHRYGAVSITCPTASSSTGFTASPPSASSLWSESASRCWGRRKVYGGSRVHGSRFKEFNKSV